MKFESIVKMADLLTNPKSSHRVLPEKGEFHLGGSTNDVGSYAITIYFDQDEIYGTGFLDQQHLHIARKGDVYQMKLTRRQGGFIKENDHINVKDKEGMIKWFQNWIEEVMLEQSKPRAR